MTGDAAPEPVAWLEIGGLSRAAAEALTLELRRLARRCEIDIREVRVEQDSSGRERSA